MSKNKAVTIQLEGDIDLTPVSAYDAAKADGYLGTEEQYAKELAAEPPTQEMFDALPGRILGITQTTEKADFHHITDSAAGKVLDFGMEGKTEQETTSGKNVWSYGDVSGTKLKGVPCSIPAGTYAFSANVVSSDTDSDNVTVSFVIPEGTAKSFKLPRGNRSSSIVTFDAEVTQVNFIAANTTANAEGDTFSFTDIQIEEGSVVTDYEPFTNGPSPNPDFPQEIVNAGRKSKNLWNKEYASDINNWNDVGDGYCVMPIYVGINNPVSYSYKDTLSTGLPFYAGFCTKDDYTVDVWMYHASNESATYKEYAKLTPTTTDYVYVRVTKAGLENGSFMQYIGNDLQIEIGTEVTDYESYGVYKIGCALLKENLLDTAKLEYGYIQKDGTHTSDTWYYHTDYIWVKGAKTVYLSGCENTTGTLRYVCFYDAEYNYISGVQQVLIMSIPVPENAVYFRCNVAPSKLNEAILTANTVQDAYSAYEANPFTLTSDRPLTMWDPLIKRDGVWGWSINSKHDYYKTVEIVSNGSKEGVYCYRCYIPDKAIGDVNIRCTSFQNVEKAYNTYKLWTFSGTPGSGFYLYFNTPYETVEEFKAHLNENPLEIWYETAEEQAFIPLTAEEQELLNNLETYYGVTNMYNDQGCPMWFTYAADMKLYIDNKFKG